MTSGQAVEAVLVEEDEDVGQVRFPEPVQLDAEENVRRLRRRLALTWCVMGGGVVMVSGLSVWMYFIFV